MEERFAELYERYGEEVPMSEFQSREERDSYIWDYCYSRQHGGSHEEGMQEHKTNTEKYPVKPQAPLTAEEMKAAEDSLRKNVGSEYLFK